MRLAIIADIHEDYLSLQKVLQRIESRGYDKLICLGDICGFSIPYYRYRKSRNASACLEMIREKCGIIIPGNHDLHVAKKIPVHAASFEFPEHWYDLDFKQRNDWSERNIWLHEDDLDSGLSSGDLEFIRSLPEYSILKTPGYNIMFSHYAYPNLSGFNKHFYSWEREFERHFTWMKANNCSMGFIGHAHPWGFYMVTPDRFRQFTYRSLPVREFPAIIGLPPVTRQHYRRGFCIFDTDSRMIRVTKRF